MIEASKAAFDKYKVNDRVKLIEGPANESIDKLEGTFDLVFVDANKDGYEGYVKQILDKKLLSDDGIILCDNGRLFLANCETLNADYSQSLRQGSHGGQRRQPVAQQRCASILDSMWPGSKAVQHLRCIRPQGRCDCLAAVRRHLADQMEGR